MPRGQRAVELKDASIATVSVTLKALQVNNKQMTQSVFRQLPVATLVDEREVKLNGVVWGHVNYRWDGTPPDVKQFVFQSGGLLYRSPFRVRYSNSWQFRDAKPSGFNDILFRAEWVEVNHLLHKLSDGLTPSLYGNTNGWGDDAQGLKFSGRFWFSEHETIRLGKKAYDLVYKRSSLEHAKEKLREPGQLSTANQQKFWRDQVVELTPIVNSLESEIRQTLSVTVGEPFDDEGVEAARAKLKADAADFRKRWDDLMRSLNDVEQLYIAV